MKSIKEILQLSTEYLKQHAIDNSRRQAEDLISDALEISRMQLYLDFDRPLTMAEVDKCRAALARRSKGEPNAYIAGSVEFFDCKIKVSPEVLIPRQETILLAEKIAKHLQQIDLKEKTLWDVCCGSGCLGISLKKKFPDLQVVLSDISEKALDIARQNAEENQVDIQFVQGDLLAPFINQRTDFFVCNPPYIAENEFDGLDREVKLFEPKRALISGPTGLEFYERLAQTLPHHLHPKGKAWMEIGYKQRSAILDLFINPKWTRLSVEKDYSGNDRFFLLEIE